MRTDAEHTEKASASSKILAKLRLGLERGSGTGELAGAAGRCRWSSP